MRLDEPVRELLPAGTVKKPRGPGDYAARPRDASLGIARISRQHPPGRPGQPLRRLRTRTALCLPEKPRTRKTGGDHFRLQQSWSWTAGAGVWRSGPGEVIPINCERRSRARWAWPTRWSNSPPSSSADSCRGTTRSIVQYTRGIWMPWPGPGGFAPRRATCSRIWKRICTRRNMRRSPARSPYLIGFASLRPEASKSLSRGFMAPTPKPTGMTEQRPASPAMSSSIHREDCAAVVLSNYGPKPAALSRLDRRAYPAAAFGRAGHVARYRAGPGDHGISGRVAIVRRLLVHHAGGRRVYLWRGFGSAGPGGAATAAAAISAPLGISATGGHWWIHGRLLSATGLRRTGRPHDGLDMARNSLAAVVLVSGAV